MPPARKPDPQTDYEDPVDRLYRRRPKGKRDRHTPAEKTPSAVASVAFYFGIVGLIPCLGVVFAPLSILLGFIGLAQTRDPMVSGKGRAKSGLWFGLIGFVVNCLLTPVGVYLYVLAGGR